MLSRFFLSFFRAHSFHMLRIGFILFLTSVAFLLMGAITSLVESTITQETRALLGADITLESNTAMTEDELSLLSELQELYNLKIASSTQFQTNIRIGDTPYLTDIQIISNTYPLVGEKPSNRGEGVYVSTAFDSLLGDDTTLILGDTSYTIGGDIPPSSFGGFSLFTEGREVWIPQELAMVDELLGVGARVHYHYYVLAEQGNIASLRAYLEQEGVFDGWKIGDIESRQDVLSGIFSEFQKFIQVFFIGIYILAFFSLFFTFEALKRITRRDIGLFILLGCTKQRVFLALGYVLLGVYLLSFTLAYISSLGLTEFLSTFPLTESINLGISDVLRSFLLSAVILCFAVFSPARDAFQETLGALLKKTDTLSVGGYSFGMVVSLLGGIVFLLILLGASLSWIFMITLGCILAFLVLAGLIQVYFFTLYKLASHYKEKYFLAYYTLRSCVRPGNMTLFITLPVMIVGTVFFFFMVFAQSLLDITQAPDDTENYFILNIESSEKEVLEERFPQIQVYDIFLARIISINGAPLREHVGDTQAGREFTREFNLTTHPLQDNPYTLGVPLTTRGISLDESFAVRLGVEIGDVITFLLSGREVDFTVQNTRPAVRGDFRPFFYFQLLPEDIVGLERSFFAILSDIDMSPNELRNELFILSPRLQLLDLSETLKEVSRILGQVYQGVLAISIYVGVFVWILLSISLTVLGYIRQKEATVLSLLGASRKFCRNNLKLEYLSLLSFSFIGIFFLGTLLSVLFFQNSSFLTLQLNYILQATIIVLLGGCTLFVSLTSFRKKE